MKQWVPALLILLGIFAELILTGCCRDDTDEDLAPLVVNTDTPLLLEEPEETESGPAKKLSEAETENAACFVCHANYTEDPLVKQHIKKDIACVNCHGKSYAHRNDENHTTPPDHMFGAETVVQLCTKCHDAHKISDEKLEELKNRRKDKPESAPVVCTDCHGKHRLAKRSVRWNKTTGELIKDSQ
ncbi:MAG: cytochrome c3 family protein [Planctomycetota bacterium]|jgi:hypothetical protein